MKKFYLIGRVLPRNVLISIPPLKIDWKISERETAGFYIRVTDSIVHVHTKISCSEDSHSTRNGIIKFIEQLINSYGFLNAHDLSFEIQAFFQDEFQVVHVDGAENNVWNGNLYHGEKTKFQHMVLAKQKMHSFPYNAFTERAIYELRQASGQVDYTALHCKLAIESIRNAFSSSSPKKDKVAWEEMRNSLNLTRKIIQKFDNTADTQRHGRNIIQTWEERQEVQQIAQEIVWRYICYVSRNSSSLELNEFPKF